MSKPLSKPDVYKDLQDIDDRLTRLERNVINASVTVRSVYATQGDLPSAAASKGLIVLVEGNAAGTKFQGSDGTSWVPLG